jgi:hypothetical protein
MADGNMLHFSTGYGTAHFGSRKLVHMLNRFYIGGSAKQTAELGSERLVFSKVEEKTAGAGGVEWMRMLSANSVNKYYTVDYMIARPKEGFVIAYAHERNSDGSLKMD